MMMWLRWFYCPTSYPQFGLLVTLSPHSTTPSESDNKTLEFYLSYKLRYSWYGWPNSSANVEYALTIMLGQRPVWTCWAGPFWFNKSSSSPSSCRAFREFTTISTVHLRQQRLLLSDILQVGHNLSLLFLQFGFLGFALSFQGSEFNFFFFPSFSPTFSNFQGQKIQGFMEMMKSIKGLQEEEDDDDEDDYVKKEVVSSLKGQCFSISTSPWVH